MHLGRALLWLLLLFPVYSQEEAPLARAQALLRQGKAQDALVILLAVHRSEPSNADVCQQIGIAYTQLEDLAHAEEFYREAVRLNPQFWAARKNLGTVLWYLDRKEESEREFQAVTRVLPADPVPHLYLALAAHARGDFNRANVQFGWAGALAFENPEVVPAILESYLATREARFSETAMEQLTRAAVQKKSPEVWRMLAAARDRQGEPEQAYKAFSQAIEADPLSEDSYTALAEFASSHGNNDYALQVVARGLKQMPQSPGLLFEQGILWAVKGDRNQAESSFTQASRLKADWSLPLLALGVSRLEAGETAQAADLFQKARAADPRDSRALYLYATALSRDSGISSENQAKAVAALRQAIALNPKDARSHALLGQLDLAAGKPDAAALDWQTALKIDPENTTALYQLGLLYRKQGKTEQAERLLATFQRVKAKKRNEEESLVEILRVVPEKP
jgi:tetratricopeptide (TPR) repeat protein